MAMPQRDETIEEIKRLDALLEYAVMHDDEAEAAPRRADGRAQAFYPRSTGLQIISFAPLSGGAN